MELEETARKFALKNAVEHDGEANAGSVIGQVINDAGADPEEVQKVAGRVVSDVNSMDLEEQREEIERFQYEDDEQEHDPLPDLKDAEEGNVVLRFAPNPNGPPHLGHARGMVINGELRDKYDGKLILRFDDTDPVNKRPLKEAYEMYEEDFNWLGYEPDEVRYSSENFETYIEYAEKLIEMGKAYVCKCSREEGHRHREEGTECPCRSGSPNENMDLWQEMREGGIGEGGATLKIKTDMQHRNPAARDFVAFRIIENPDHPVTGDEYRVWPMLDFAGAIEDQVMGTTHIVRGKDLRDSTTRQKFIYDYLDWEYPNVRYWGTVEVTGFNAPLSTSSIAEMVQDGDLEGWDDPQCGTLRALRKRGFQPEAIRSFFTEMGVNEKDSEASVATLEAENRSIVEESDRYFFVREPVELEVEGVPEDVKARPAFHPDHPERGERQLDVERDGGTARVLIEERDLENGLLRLKGFCNVEIQGTSAEYIDGDHTVALERDADIIHWVPSGSDKADVVMPDGSVTQGRIEDVDIEPGEVVQFERFGFVRRGDGEESSFLYAHD
ncbi:MAG: glutamate--tRNA ligase [Candidatus Nanohaloarchaea archaeon]